MLNEHAAVRGRLSVFLEPKARDNELSEDDQFPSLSDESGVNRLDGTVGAGRRSLRGICVIGRGRICRPEVSGAQRSVVIGGSRRITGRIRWFSVVSLDQVAKKILAAVPFVQEDPMRCMIRSPGEKLRVRVETSSTRSTQSVSIYEDEMLHCRGGTRLSMPLRLLREYVRAQVLREADPQNLKTAREGFGYFPRESATRAGRIDRRIFTEYSHFLRFLFSFSASMMELMTLSRCVARRFVYFIDLRSELIEHVFFIALVWPFYKPTSKTVKIRGA